MLEVENEQRAQAMLHAHDGGRLACELFQERCI